MDGRAWWATVHGVTESQTQLSNCTSVEGYKISTQKSLAFLYTNNEKSEREIKESIPFTIATTTTKNI